MTRILPTRRRSALRLTAALSCALACGALLAGCGRNGPPEYAGADDTPKPAAAKQLIPGLSLPHASADAAPQKKPKGNFILDPLL